MLSHGGGKRDAWIKAASTCCLKVGPKHILPHALEACTFEEKGLSKVSHISLRLSCGWTLQSVKVMRELHRTDAKMKQRFVARSRLESCFVSASRRCILAVSKIGKKKRNRLRCVPVLFWSAYLEILSCLHPLLAFVCSTPGLTLTYINSFVVLSRLLRHNKTWKIGRLTPVTCLCVEVVERQAELVAYACTSMRCQVRRFGFTPLETFTCNMYLYAGEMN